MAAGARWWFVRWRARFQMSSREIPYTTEIYEPLKAVAPFHSSRSKWRIVVGSNRSGKTLCAAVELARAVTGTDPYKKYRPSDGVAVVLGLDYNHIGMLWRKLYLPGAIKILYDDRTKRWRPLKYDRSNDRITISKRDIEMRKKWRDAPPLIPPEDIAKIAWYNQSLLQPFMVRMKNGWQIIFISSRSSPKQGEHFDLVWIDEQIQNPAHLWELSRAIVDVDPMYPAYGIWSASGQKQNTLLYDLVQKTDRKLVSVFNMSIRDNPFVTEDELNRFAAMLPEYERQIRIEGKFAVELWQIYHDFDPEKHIVQPFNIPVEWTRYIAVDPGNTTCATAFVAVDPRNNIYVYDVNVLHQSTASMWADMLASRQDANMFEAWIIDKRAGRTKGIGQKQTVAEVYMQEAVARNLRPRVFGSMGGFVPGCDVPELRIEIMHRYFSGDGSNKPFIRFFPHCQELFNQFTTAQYDERRPGKRIKGTFDLLDAVEYIAAYEPKYVERVIQPRYAVEPVMRSYFERHKRHGNVGNTISFG
mgnify:CR=1 FL=1